VLGVKKNFNFILKNNNVLYLFFGFISGVEMLVDDYDGNVRGFV